MEKGIWTGKELVTWPVDGNGYPHHGQWRTDHPDVPAQAYVELPGDGTFIHDPTLEAQANYAGVSLDEAHTDKAHREIMRNAYYPLANQQADEIEQATGLKSYRNQWRFGSEWPQVSVEQHRKYFPEFDERLARLPKWEPGMQGKGMVVNDTSEPITWGDIDVKPEDFPEIPHLQHVPELHHEDVAQFLGGMFHNKVYIDPTGKVEGWADTDTQPFVDADPRLHTGTGDLWRFGVSDANPQPLYHVAPRSARESIQQHGLRGHEFTDTGPWAGKYWKGREEQPEGNYFWPDVESAYDYARMLAQNKYGDDGDDVWQDLIGDEYDEDPTEAMQAAAAHHGYDIWRAFPDERQVLRTDPEHAIHTQEYPEHYNPAGELSQAEALHQLRQDRENEGDAWEYTTEREPMRWFTPDVVHPDQLNIDSSHTPWDLVADEDDPYTNEVPEPLARVPFNRYFGRSALPGEETPPEPVDPSSWFNKALKLKDGKWLTWDEPHAHMVYAQMHNIPFDDIAEMWGWSPNAGWFNYTDSYEPNAYKDIYDELGEQKERGQWIFGASVAYEDWEPGHTGKALTFPDGDVIAWKTDKEGSPHHWDVWGPERSIKATGYYDIDPNGDVWRAATSTKAKGAELVARYIGGQVSPEDTDTWHLGAVGNLNWEPGQWGKGLLDPYGDWHTWNTDRASGDPHHEDYLLDHFGNVPQGFDYYNNTFFIDPDGRLDHDMPVEEIKPLIDQDERLYSPLLNKVQWHFGATDWQVVDSDFDPANSYLGDMGGYYTHSPFIGDEKTKTIYLGQPGVHHDDLGPHHGLSHWSQGPFGAVNHGIISVGNPTISDTDNTAREIADALHEHLGPGFSDDVDDNAQWLFSKALSSKAKYQKGLRLHNGEEIFWNIRPMLPFGYDPETHDEDDFEGAPTHADYMERNGIDFNDVQAYLRRGPSGNIQEYPNEGPWNERGWRFGAVTPYIPEGPENWQRGQGGWRYALVGNKVYAWGRDKQSRPDDEVTAHHYEYLQSKGILDDQWGLGPGQRSITDYRGMQNDGVKDLGWIKRDGEVTSAFGDPYPEVVDAHPDWWRTGLTWHFGAAQDIQWQTPWDDETLHYEPTEYRGQMIEPLGKYLILNDGRAYRWTTNTFGSPHHSEVLDWLSEGHPRGMGFGDVKELGDLPQDSQWILGAAAQNNKIGSTQVGHPVLQFPDGTQLIGEDSEGHYDLAKRHGISVQDLQKARRGFIGADGQPLWMNDVKRMLDGDWNFEAAAQNTRTAMSPTAMYTEQIPLLDLNGEIIEGDDGESHPETMERLGIDPADVVRYGYRETINGKTRTAWYDEPDWHFSKQADQQYPQRSLVREIEDNAGNCKHCYNQRGFFTSDGWVPCAWCMRGKLPPSGDARINTPYPEQKEIEKQRQLIPNTDLRQEGIEQIPRRDLRASLSPVWATDEGDQPDNPPFSMAEGPQKLTAPARENSAASTLAAFLRSTENANWTFLERQGYRDSPERPQEAHRAADTFLGWFDPRVRGYELRRAEKVAAIMQSGSPPLPAPPARRMAEDEAERPAYSPGYHTARATLYSAGYGDGKSRPSFKGGSFSERGECPSSNQKMKFGYGEDIASNKEASASVIGDENVPEMQTQTNRGSVLTGPEAMQGLSSRIGPRALEEQAAYRRTEAAQSRQHQEENSRTLGVEQSGQGDYPVRRLRGDQGPEQNGLGSSAWDFEGSRRQHADLAGPRAEGQGRNRQVRIGMSLVSYQAEPEARSGSLLRQEAILGSHRTEASHLGSESIRVGVPKSENEISVGDEQGDANGLAKGLLPVLDYPASIPGTTRAFLIGPDAIHLGAPGASHDDLHQAAGNHDYDWDAGWIDNDGRVQFFQPLGDLEDRIRLSLEHHLNQPVEKDDRWHFGAVDRNWQSWIDDYVDRGLDPDVIPGESHWQPGGYGKGTYEHNHGLTTWTTDAEYGAPHHPMHTTFDLTIDPDGNVMLMRGHENFDDEDQEAASKADPRLNWAGALDNQWNFSKVAASVEDLRNVWGDNIRPEDEDDRGRYPIMQYPNGHTLLGPEGAQHYDILNLNEDWDDRSDRRHGFIQTNPDGLTGGYLEWYDEPHDHEGAMQELGKIFPDLDGDPRSYSSWNFSKTAARNRIDYHELTPEDMEGHKPISEWSTMFPDDTYQERRPLVYDRDAMALIVGPKDYAHDDVQAAALKKGVGGEGPYSYGWIGHNPEEPETGHYGWYVPPDEEWEIRDLLYSKGLKRDTGLDTWHFGAIQVKPVGGAAVNRQGIHPIIANEADQTLYVGPEGAMHGVVYDNIPMPTRGHSRGLADAKKMEYTWLDGTPDNPEFDQYMGSHGWTNKDNLWHFGHYGEYVEGEFDQPWELGNHGKGLVLNNGEVRTWHFEPVNGTFFGHHVGHPEYSQSRNFFDIEPSGEYSLHKDDENNSPQVAEDVRLIQAHDPRLNFRYGWRFGKIAGLPWDMPSDEVKKRVHEYWSSSCPNCGAEWKDTERAGYLGSARYCRKCHHEWSMDPNSILQDDPPLPERSETPQIFEGQSGAYSQYPNDGGYQRRPAIYIPRLNHVYVGPEGAYHSDIHKDFKHLDNHELEDDRLEGYIGNKQGEFWDTTMQQDEAPPEILQAMQDKYGVPFTNESERGQTWHFATVIPQWAGDPEDADPMNEGEWPILYDGNTGELLVGHEGLHHGDLARYNSGYHHGVAATINNPNGGAFEPNTVTWLEAERPQNEEEIVQAISDLIGHQFKPEPPGEVWKFARGEKMVPWTPGQFGKGLYHPDKGLILWAGNEPHHQPTADNYGYPFDDKFDMLRVYPDGRVGGWIGPVKPENEQGILAADPRLSIFEQKPGDLGGFDFDDQDGGIPAAIGEPRDASVRAQEGAQPPLHIVAVQEAEPDRNTLQIETYEPHELGGNGSLTDDAWVNGDYTKRRPMFYEPRFNTLHIGPYDYSHSAVVGGIWQRFPDRYDKSYPAGQYGYIGPNPDAGNGDDIDEGTYGWYTKPENEHEIRWELERRGLTSDPDRDKWHFGAHVDLDELPEWQPGIPGKGLFYREITNPYDRDAEKDEYGPWQLRTWPVDEEGDPHHIDVNVEGDTGPEIFIGPDGRTDVAWGENSLSPEVTNSLISAHPYLNRSKSGEYYPFQPNSWTFSAYGDSKYDPQTGEWEAFEPWEPGEWGKGILYENPHGEPWVEIETWAVDTLGVEDDPGYHHQDMADRVGTKNWITSFEIDPNGEIMSLAADPENIEPYMEEIMKLDPRLKPEKIQGWHFGSNDVINGGHNVPRIDNSIWTTAPWEPGRPGKGLYLDGKLHLWAQEGGMEPHHDDIFALQRGADAYNEKTDWTDYYAAPKLTIDPDGTIMTMRMTNPVGGKNEHVFDPKMFDQIAAMHPDLRHDQTEAWNF